MKLIIKKIASYIVIASTLIFIVYIMSLRLSNPDITNIRFFLTYWIECIVLTALIILSDALVLFVLKKD